MTKLLPFVSDMKSSVFSDSYSNWLSLVFQLPIWRTAGALTSFFFTSFVRAFRDFLSYSLSSKLPAFFIARFALRSLINFADYIFKSSTTLSPREPTSLGFRSKFPKLTDLVTRLGRDFRADLNYFLSSSCLGVGAGLWLAVLIFGEVKSRGWLRISLFVLERLGVIVRMSLSWKNRRRLSSYNSCSSSFPEIGVFTYLLMLMISLRSYLTLVVCKVENFADYLLDLRFLRNDI